jgi:hypothetical protein
MSEADNQDDLSGALMDAERFLGESVETAAEEVIPETSEEVPETNSEETVVEEDESHSEKSRLGRKVARQEREIGKLTSKIDLLLEHNSKLMEMMDRSKEPEPEPILPEDPTAEEIAEYVKQTRDRLKRDIQNEVTTKPTKEEDHKRYASEYAEMLEGTIDPDEDKELFELLTSTKDLSFNQKLSDDPKKDFLANYKAATKHLLNQAKPPVRPKTLGKKPAPVNAPTETQGKAKVVDIKSWSKEEQELAKMFSPEELAKMGL